VPGTPLFARLPDALGALGELATNLWFSWNPDARALFARLDRVVWEAVGRDPVAALARMPQEALRSAAADPGYVAELARVHGRMREELAARSWYEEWHEADADALVAYFCCEFGLDASLPIYSGGLGVLAGDHLKSASDLGVPLVGVGLLYEKGYFRQAITGDGRQSERYPANDPEGMAITLGRRPGGTPLEVRVDLAGEQVRVHVWRVQVGRVPLYLLDSDVDGNSGPARDVTGVLYGGDREMRIRQEMLLGVGGVRALAALGRAPTVFHLNEGHSAFLALERVRALVAAGSSIEEARALVRASSVFTTHTPVPAGNEVFDPDLVRRYLGGLAGEMGLEVRDLLELGRIDAGDTGFGMTPLALRTAARANGVSALHGEVSRAMWRPLFPGRSTREVPIGHVTNGVHPGTWRDPAVTADLPDEELWAAHRRGVDRLVRFARPRWGEGPGSELDPDALTIGFARRFATYKRAGLLFHDPERLARLVTDRERPVQFVISGKAHPADAGGKALIAEVVQRSKDPRLAGRIVFLPDYDMGSARILVQGVDVWLNTPRRPMEASGTSGMKAAMNGALNLSVLDGWWAEGYSPEVGWAIGGTEVHPDEERQDAADAEALYRLLEEAVVPCFHDRDAGGLPRTWIGMLRAAMALGESRFSTHRMLREYTEALYLPAHRDGRHAEAREAVA
jgi:starch phosphorylase